MTVADKLAALAAAKAEIVRAVQDRGGGLAGDPPISEIAPAIDALPESGGGESGVVGVVKTGEIIDLDAKIIDFSGASGQIRNYFAYCAQVEELRGTQNVTSINVSAFNKCNKLASVTFPSVVSVATNVFQNCSNMRTASFPRLESIAANAFYGCSGLETLIVGTEASAVATLANTNAFTDTRATMRIVVPDALVDEYKTATNWTAYASRIIGVTEWEATK